MVTTSNFWGQSRNITTWKKELLRNVAFSKHTRKIIPFFSNFHLNRQFYCEGVTCLQGIYDIYFAMSFSTKISNHKKIQRHKLGWHLILKDNYKVFNFFLKNEPAMTIEKIKMVPEWFISTLTCTTSKNNNELRFFPLHLKWRIRKLSVPNFVSGKKKFEFQSSTTFGSSWIFN